MTYTPYTLNDRNQHANTRIHANVLIGENSFENSSTNSKPRRPRIGEKSRNQPVVPGTLGTEGLRKGQRIHTGGG